MKNFSQFLISILVLVIVSCSLIDDPVGKASGDIFINPDFKENISIEEEVNILEKSSIKLTHAKFSISSKEVDQLNFVMKKGREKIEDKYIIELGKGLISIPQFKRSSEIEKIDKIQNSIRSLVGDHYKGSVKNVINGIFISNPSSRSLKEIKDRFPHVKIHRDKIKYASLMDSVPLIGANQVWSYGYNGSGVKIAILDTGIDYSHKDFGSCINLDNCPKIIDGYDFVNLDNDPFDDRGHGTHVAGIVASEGELKGVAPGASLQIYKILDSDGYGYDSDIIKALEKATDLNGDGDFSDKADIISMSIGGSGTPNDPLSIAVDNANNIGSLVVVAAGNFWSGADYGNIDCPGCARNAFTVGATDKEDSIAYFSGKGPVLFNQENIIKPDISATGVSICSADAYSQYDADCFDDEHLTLRGTSMSTPMISGVAALLIDANSYGYAPEDIKSILTQSAVNLGYDIFTQGGGRVNASRIIKPLEAYIKPHILNLGIINHSNSSREFTFDIINNDYLKQDISVILSDLNVNNIEADESFTFKIIENELCLNKEISTYNFKSELNLDNLSNGYYSGDIKIDIYENCGDLKTYSQSINLPVGFSKLNEFKINFIGTRPIGNRGYWYHDNYFTIINEDGEVTRYSFFEYGDKYNFNYTIYLLENKFDIVGLSIENAYYPTYDRLNVNYFIDHIDTDTMNFIIFDETKAQHIEQNIVDVASSKNLEVYGFMTEILQKEDYYSNLLYYFHPWTGPFKYVDFGIYSNNEDNLFFNDYMIYFSPHARDIGSDYYTTQNYMVTPLTINYPFTDFIKNISQEDLKTQYIKITDNLIPYFNQNLYFGINSYTPLNYWSDANPELIHTPRNGKFFYLDNCDECYYHYHLKIFDSELADNSYIWTNYFDGKAKYIPETTGKKLKYISFFEEPLKLGLDTRHCVEYSPGSFYFCKNEDILKYDDVLRGFLNDRFNAKSHLMTGATSGELLIKTPLGNTYSIFQDDQTTLEFGRYGSWIIDCTDTTLSSPDTLINDEFCEDGLYRIYWKMSDVVNKSTLKLFAKVEHKNNKFQIKLLCTKEDSRSHLGDIYDLKIGSSWICNQEQSY